MKALVLRGNENISYEEVDTPKCPEGGMLLKIEAVGLCGSDVRTYKVGHPQLTYPAILGHENVGTIERIGAGAETELQVGDRVVVYPAIPCGRCDYCLKGLHVLCKSKVILGTEIPGGFADYMALPPELIQRGMLLKVPDGVKSGDMAVVELLSSITATHENIRVGMAETVVIIGTGPAGCLHSDLAKLNGAKNIIMVDLLDERLEMAANFSGTHFINSSNQDVRQSVMDITNGNGADISIVAAPSTDAHQQSLEFLAKRGKLVIFGGLNKENPYSTMDANLIHYNELSVIGVYGYGMLTFKKAFDLVASGMINTNIITHILPLQDIIKGINLIQSGQALKVVLKP